jgi:hypothetical protein
VSTDQQLLEQLRQVNPVPADAERPEAMWSSAALFANVEQRSGTMKTYQDVSEVRDVESPTQPRGPRWRGPLIAATAAVVALLIVGAPTTLVPDISPDLSNFGEALTAAHNAADPEVFLGLFAEDAEIRLDNQALTPDEVRAAGPLPGMGSNLQYDRGWITTMNQRYDYSSCQVNGDRVLCDMTVTSDYLAPLLPPDPHTVAAQVLEGEIVLFVVSGLFSVVDDIMADFQDWTQDNYPEEADLMWVNDWEAVEVPTEESALLHLRLGEEYAQLQQ